MSLMFSRKILLSAIVAAFALAPSIASASTNLITNGDFSLGFDGSFTTDYNQVAPTANSMVPEGNITIAANPISVHSSWVDLTGGVPPMAPTNPMLIANGATGSAASGLSIWQTALTVVSGKNYNFSAGVMNVCCNVTFTGANSPSTIIFEASADGVHWTDLAQRTTAPGDAGTLETITGSYLATANNVTLRAINTIDAASGNDFALDNLSFASAVPEPGTWAMLFLGFGAIGLMMRRRQSRGLAIAA
jgi:PEP-CTERM motif